MTVAVPAGVELGTVEETSLTIMEFGDIATNVTLSVQTTVVDELNVYLPALSRP